MPSIVEPVEDQFRHGQPPASLGKIIGHSDGAQIDVRLVAVVDHSDQDVIGVNRNFHLDPHPVTAGTTVLDDVRHDLCHRDPGLSANSVRYVSVA